MNDPIKNLERRKADGCPALTVTSAATWISTAAGMRNEEIEQLIQVAFDNEDYHILTIFRDELYHRKQKS